MADKPDLKVVPLMDRKINIPNTKIKWCWLGFHHWTPWTDQPVIEVFTSTTAKYPSYRKLPQTRVCTDCNKREIRSVRI